MDEVMGVYIKYVDTLIHVNTYQKALIFTEAAKGPVNRMKGSLEANELLSFATPEFAQKHHEQSRGMITEMKLSMGLAIWTSSHQG